VIHAQVGWLSVLAEVENGAAPPAPPPATLAADFRSLSKPERSPDLVDGISDDPRLAFRAALRALRRARAYYVLDGFVTEHVDLARLESTCWKLVSVTETDYARLQQMRRRRVARLDPLRDELKADAYRDLRATLGYEVAQVLAVILEAKAERLRRYAGNALRTRQEALEALKNRTCDVFDDFLKQCAGDARTPPGETPRSPVERLADSDVAAYMDAQFLAARLRGKRYVAIPGDVRHAEDSLTRYKQCVADMAFVKKNRDVPADFFARELELCEQMVHLLPSKIQHVQLAGGVLEDF